MQYSSIKYFILANKKIPLHIIIISTNIYTHHKMLNLSISPENLYCSILTICCAILVLALIYHIYYKKNPKIVFDRIISRGKFRSSISLIIFIISLFIFLSWLFIKLTNVSSNELVQYDNSENTITISAKPIPNDSVTYKVQFVNEPSKHQKEEIARLIDQWYQSKTIQSSEIASDSINDDVSNRRKPLFVEFSTSTSADSTEVKKSILTKIDSVANAHTPGLLWSTFYHIIDPGNQHMARTPMARGIALLLSIFGSIFLTGLFISVLTNIFDSRRERWAKGMLRYRGIKNHYVIVGCNEMVPNIINQIFANYRKRNNTHHNSYLDETLPYIIILTSSDVEAQRDILFSQLDKNEQKRIVFYYGNRSSAEDVKSLNPHKAKEVYVLGESVDKDRNGQITRNGEPHHDALNLTCVEHIATSLKATTDFSTPDSAIAKIANITWQILKGIYNGFVKLLKFLTPIVKNLFAKLGKSISSINGTKVGKTFNSLKISKEKLLNSIIETDDDDDLKDHEFEDIKLEGYQRPTPKTNNTPKEQISVATTSENTTTNEQEQEPVAKKAENKPERLICHVLFEYQTAFSIFQSADLAKEISEVIDFRPFNYYESWAQKVFVENKATLSFDNSNNKIVEYSPLDCNNINTQSDKHVHLVVVGMSKMGVAMALEAAHICHYPNFIDKGIRTRITFIDSHASQEMNFFKGRFKDMFEVARWRYIKADDYRTTGLFDKTRDEIYDETETWRDPLKDAASESPYKHLAQNSESFLDIEWEFIEGSLECPSVQHYLKQASLDNKSMLTVAICLPKAHQAIAAGIYLPREVFDNAKQVLIYQRESSDIIKPLKNKNIRPFGMLNCCYDIANDETAFIQAKLVNYVYNTYDKKATKIDDVNNISEISDKIEEYWKNCGVEDIWSNIYNANSIPAKLRAYNIATADFATMLETIKTNIIPFAKVEHNRWNVEKLLMGFRPLTEPERSNLASLLNATSHKSAEDLNGTDWKAERNALKSRPQKAHVDICPFDMLSSIDPYIHLADEAISKAIPHILKLSSETK